MKKGPLLTSLAVLVLGAGACFLVWRQTDPGHGHAHPDPDHAGEGHGGEPAKGPHGGRLLVNGTFTCEVSIFEDGVPPEFRVHCTQAGAPVDPAAVKLAIELRRLLGRVDRIGFAPQADYLRGDRTVEEPHSFDVKVIAEHAGRQHQWEYASHEGRVELTPEQAQASGVSVQEAGPATIRTALTVYGKLLPNEERLAHVMPRFPGIVREVRKRVGDEASKDEPLARIESNDSLQTYIVSSPIAGTVIQRHVTAGEVVHEDDELFVVCDLGLVWASFDVPQKDAARVKPGQVLAVRVEGEEAPRISRVAHVSPVGIEATQAVRIRAELENAGGQLRPGLFVVGEIVLEEVTVPLAVRVGGLQRFRDWDVVFIQDGNLFEIRPLELGRRDAEWVEVISGLAPGQRYAAAGSFLLRADAGKSGASHDH